MFRKLSALVFICVATIGAASTPVLAKGPSRDAACAGLSGAAFGVCQAAIAVGCDGTANQPTSCINIQTKYTQLTGDPTPPWTMPPCPCGTSEDFVTFAGTKDVFCRVQVTDSGASILRLDPTGARQPADNYVFSFFPGSLAIEDKQTCGFRWISQANVTDAEAKSCMAEISAAALALFTRCP